MTYFIYKKIKIKEEKIRKMMTYFIYKKKKEKKNKKNDLLYL
jgi:hypothetical protein